jgi:AraC-like DNA-binding protein
VPEPSTALEGCTVLRPSPGTELVLADARSRAFPARVGNSLGICLKRGPAHEVRADGRRERYPRDAICVRPPGCVWSSDDTGPAAFVSIDLGPPLLPESLRVDRMTFVPRSVLPSFDASVRALLAHDGDEEAADLLVALHRAAAIEAREIDGAPRHHSVRRARALLTDDLASPPSLDELARAVGENKFVLLRRFKRELGMTPRAYVVAARIAGAREHLARGASSAEVAMRWGFADQAHLTRQFRKSVGLTPAEYARRVRGR